MPRRKNYAGSNSAAGSDSESFRGSGPGGEYSGAVQKLIESKRWNGYVSGVVPYGFKRTEGKLIPDPDTSSVVRKIFDMALEGERITAIATWLSEEGISSPSDRKSPEAIILTDSRNGDAVKTVISTQASRWSDNTIRDMLRNEVYAQGIVERDLFEKVQMRFDGNRRETTQRSRGLYQGLVCCGSCQRAMAYQGTDVNGRKKATYFCKFHTGANPKSEPFEHMPKVDEEVLKEEVLRQCNRYIEGFSTEKLTPVLEELMEKEQSAEKKLRDLGEKLIRGVSISTKGNQGLWIAWEQARRRYLAATAYAFLLGHRFKTYQFGHMDENDLDTEHKLIESIIVYPDGKITVRFLGYKIFGAV